MMLQAAATNTLREVLTRRAGCARRRGAFTLVELILVLVLMATVAAIAAPTLSRSLRARHLDQEGLRILAMTELGRSSAISEGVPIIFWVDAAGGRFGVEPKEGYDADASATREFSLGEDVHFEEITGARGADAAENSVEFGPDGMPEALTIESMKISDRFGNALTVIRTDDGWGYEILKEGTP